MGKNNVSAGNSWLDVVKKAFRSPTKSPKSSKKREEHDQQDDDKKRGKQRWIFSKPCIYETTIQHCESANRAATCNHTCSSIAGSRTLAGRDMKSKDDDSKERRAIALAMVTTATAQAAVATAQAAVEVMRLAGPSKFARKYYNAAVVIQTAFRGYLARRALRALKGIVKIQALVRGHNVRKRAKMTLRCIQSLVRVQTRVRDQRRRLSYEGSKDPTCSVSNSLRDNHVAARKSLSRERSSTTNELDSHQHTLEEIKAILLKTKQAASENAFSTAFPRQKWRCGKDQYLCKEKEEENYSWSEYWDKMNRKSRSQSDPIRTVEIDTAQRYSYPVPSSRESQYNHCQYQEQRPISDSVCSSMHRTNRNQSSPFPSTPSPSKTKRLQVHSASPRCLKEERNRIMAQTPTLGSNFYKMLGHEYGGAASVPNYMAATASANARIRSESAPRQRPLTPERENLSHVKKRLSFPAPKADACGVMSDTESERSLRHPNSTRGVQFVAGRRSSTLLQRQPW
ncbi:hypothetical protein AgCh_014596 [Apium graveolens]